LNKNIWIGLSSPYGLSLKNIEIKRKQTKYKNKIITKKNKKRKPNKPNTKQIQQTHHIFFLAWCYLVWAVQPIWFEKSTNKKKTNEKPKGTNHNKKTKESKQIPKNKKQKTNKKKYFMQFHEIS
jgi:hypothetical protein